MDTNPKRRQFLKFLLSRCGMATAVCVGLASPSIVLAIWPRAAFEATSIPAALTSLLGSNTTTTKRYATEVKARPHLADGETQITVSVTTSIPNIDSITLLTTGNPTPLIACFMFSKAMVESLTTRIRMDGKGDVVAIIKSENRLFSESTSVDFSSCGCG